MVVACWCHCMHCDWGSFSIFTLGKMSHDRYHVTVIHIFKFILSTTNEQKKKDSNINVGESTVALMILVILSILSEHLKLYRFATLE